MEEKLSVKEQIKKTFIALLSEKEYSDITVSELAEKAGVSRMSFYRNFNSTDDIIESIANDFLYDFSSVVLPVIQENTERKWKDFVFETVYHFYKFGRTLNVPLNEYAKQFSHSFGIIMSRVNDKMTRSERETISNYTAEKYIIFGKIGFVNAIVRQWVEMGMRESPDEMITQIMSAITKL